MPGFFKSVGKGSLKTHPHPIHSKQVCFNVSGYLKYCRANCKSVFPFIQNKLKIR